MANDTIARWRVPNSGASNRFGPQGLALSSRDSILHLFTVVSLVASLVATLVATLIASLVASLVAHGFHSSECW